MTLELPESEIRTMWDLSMVPQGFDNLKTLNMSDSLHLTTTPDFTRLPCLETLNLRGCSSLLEVHISIGSLARLVSLNLEFCSNLRSLPDSICSLRALEVLNIKCCTTLEALPIELGNIKSLKVLDASVLSVSKFPDSIGCLSNLVKLSIYQSQNIVTLPESIGNLRSLEFLNISFWEKLEEFPDQLGKMTSLKELHAFNVNLLKLLPDISQLSHLEDLDLRHCNNLLSISELPPNLERIEAGYCRSMKRLPDLSNLKQLKRLDLRNCKVLTEVQGLEEVTSLEYLNLSNCGSMERLPNLSNLKQLEELELTNCNGLTEIIGLEELTSLRKLYLTGCNSSLLTYTLTKRFFQIISGFGHKIEIYISSAEYPDRIECVATDNLQPNASYNFLAIIFCFNTFNSSRVICSVKNITSGFTWSDALYNSKNGDVSVVILPSSILPIRDGDDVEITADEEIFCGLHLLYETEITETSEHDNIVVNVEDEIGSNPSDNDLERNKNWLSPGSTTFNIVEKKRSYTSVSNLVSEMNSLSLGSNTVNVEEESSRPSKRLKHSECDNCLSP